VQALLDGGADPMLRSGFPPAPALVLAALGGKRALVAVLLAHHERHRLAVDDFAAAALGDLARLKRRLAKEPALARARDQGGLTLLHHACASRMGAHDPKRARELFALVELLVERGADVDAKANVRKSDLAPSYFAISARRFDEARLLLERGADANAALGTALWNTKEEFPRFGELCLAHGAEVDAATSDGKPLLNQLVRWGQFQQSRWLLDHGASPNLRDERGWTATHQAATRGNRNFWAVIRERGGDVTLAADGGITPALLARVKGLPVT
jgi:ankyrin repeat protein